MDLQTQPREKVHLCNKVTLGVPCPGPLPPSQGRLTLLVHAPSCWKARPLHPCAKGGRAGSEWESRMETPALVACELPGHLWKRSSNLTSVSHPGPVYTHTASQPSPWDLKTAPTSSSRRSTLHRPTAFQLHTGGMLGFHAACSM